MTLGSDSHVIADLDADVITIETSRFNMELLNAFVDFKYPNEIGPGVYDIHSPLVPPEEEFRSPNFSVSKLGCFTTHDKYYCILSIVRYCIASAT